MSAPIYRHHGVVVGYHGTDRRTAQKVLIEGADLEPGTNPYDWLGTGVYFWENGYHRAHQFAVEKQARGQIETPFVLGAYIHLGRCLDLADVWATSLLREYHEILAKAATEKGRSLPVNRSAPSGGSDLLLRFLDCAVINFCLDEADERDEGYQTVRGVFEEGGEAFPGAAIREKSHVQIAVRDQGCILGYFRPARYDGLLR